MIYRHGDLIIRECSRLPKEAQIISNAPSCVLAEGETSGHQHLLTSDAPILFLEKKNKDETRCIFRLTAPATLTHQEHKPIILDPGVYDIDQEREYDYLKQLHTPYVDD